MTVAGKSRGDHMGCASGAEANGSAGKHQPPAAGQARDRLGLVRAAGGDLCQYVREIPPVLPVAAQELERYAAPVEPGQFFLEMR